MMNSCENIHTSVPASKSIVLSIQNHGHILSFKNRKRIGKKRLFLDPKYKKRMDAITRSIESQLLSLCQISEGGTSTECLQRFLTVSLPHDDAWQVIPEIVVKGEKTHKGGEGVTILIEKLPSRLRDDV